MAPVEYRNHLTTVSILLCVHQTGTLRFYKKHFTQKGILCNSHYLFLIAA